MPKRHYLLVLSLCDVPALVRFADTHSAIEREKDSGGEFDASDGRFV